MRLDRFGGAGIHARFFATPFHFLGCVGRERHDRHVRPPEGCEAVELGRFDAVHHRHVHVHQNQIEVLCFKDIERRFAIVDDGDAMACAIEDLGDDHLIGPFVFGNQDRQWPARRNDRAIAGTIRTLGGDCCRARFAGLATNFIGSSGVDNVVMNRLRTIPAGRPSP